MKFNAKGKLVLLKNDKEIEEFGQENPHVLDFLGELEDGQVLLAAEDVKNKALENFFDNIEGDDIDKEWLKQHTTCLPVSDEILEVCFKGEWISLENAKVNFKNKYEDLKKQREETKA